MKCKLGRSSRENTYTCKLSLTSRIWAMWLARNLTQFQTQTLLFWRIFSSTLTTACLISPLCVLQMSPVLFDLSAMGVTAIWFEDQLPEFMCESSPVPRTLLQTLLVRTNLAQVLRGEWRRFHVLCHYLAFVLSPRNKFSLQILICKLLKCYNTCVYAYEQRLAFLTDFMKGGEIFWTRQLVYECFIPILAFASQEVEYFCVPFAHRREHTPQGDVKSYSVSEHLLKSCQGSVIFAKNNQFAPLAWSCFCSPRGRLLSCLAAARLLPNLAVAVNELETEGH